MSSRLRKERGGCGFFPFPVKSVEDGVDDAVQGLHVEEAAMGRVPRRTSTKHRSMLLVVTCSPKSAHNRVRFSYS
jgi:hypothetical protein